MDPKIISELTAVAMAQVPRVAVPIAVLIGGWIVALLLGALVRGALRRTHLDEAIARRVLGEQRAERFDGARWAGKAVYYTALLVVALAFLQTLELTAATQPIQTLLAQVFGFLPRIAGAVLVLFAAWLFATFSRRVIAKAMDTWDVDARLEQEGVTAADRKVAVARPLADTAYWLVLLLFMPAVLSTLELGGLLQPLQGMVDKIMAFLPNLASAGLILLLGWMVARVVQKLVTNVLTGAGLDRLGERVGVESIVGKQSLSVLAGIVVYALVLIPVFIGALNALQLTAITAPASKMLESFFAALPALFGATLLLGISYVAGRVLSSVVQRVLAGLGLDNILVRIGFTQASAPERNPSSLAGGLAMLAVVYFAAVEAARMLGFEALASLAVDLAVLGGRLLMALVVFGVGMYLANLAARAVARSGVNQARALSLLSRASILVLAGAIALRQTGIADEIIQLAFGLTFGAVAVAAALAFGFGGREAAAQLIGDLRAQWKRGSAKRDEQAAE